jgi:SagB-type dehydrogenase family enzyme
LNASWVIALPEGASASRQADGNFAIDGWNERFVIRRPTYSMQLALERLIYPGDTAARLTELIRSGDGSTEVARFTHFLRRLAAQGLLLFSVHGESGPFATLVPTATTFVLSDPFVPNGRYALSRFAHARRIDEVMILESPMAAARIVFDDVRMASIMTQLTSAKTAAQLCADSDFLSKETSRGLFSLLAAGGMITPVADDGTSAEDKNESLRMWEFHDLLFHARSRVGRHDGLIGAMLTWAGSIDPPPACRPCDENASSIALYQPDLGQLEEQDEPFARVVERRRSIREYAPQPIDSRELGEFLYRVARVKRQFQHEIEFPDGAVTFEQTARPYPSAGALYELEIYLAIQRSDGFHPGLYHYDPVGHRLFRLEADEHDLEKLWSAAAVSAAIEVQSIQVLLILAARFPRITWKYASLAYAAILKHVGVLFESMYLTATAMRLAPCALGYGDSDVFAKAIGSDYYAETSVGEFLLGSLPTETEP